MIIAVDFDGTVVKHAYPGVGDELLGATEVLLDLVQAGHDLILWTMRSGVELDDAVHWFKSRAIPLYGINGCPDQHLWTNSPKVNADLFIDDRALGSHVEIEPNGKAIVNWQEVRKHLVKLKVL